MTSIFFPFMLPLIGGSLFYLTQQEWVLVIPLLIAYILIPIMDWIVGEDLNNPPEEIVPQLEHALVEVQSLPGDY